MRRSRPVPYVGRPLRPLASVGLCVLLAACRPDIGTHPAGDASTVRAIAAPTDDTMPAREALPDCDRIGAAVGEAIAGWKLMDQSGPWAKPGQQGFGIDCHWASAQLQSGSGFEMLQGASVMVRINVSPGIQSAAEVRSIAGLSTSPPSTRWAAI